MLTAVSFRTAASASSASKLSGWNSHHKDVLSLLSLSLAATSTDEALVESTVVPWQHLFDAALLTVQTEHVLPRELVVGLGVLARLLRCRKHDDHLGSPEELEQHIAGLFSSLQSHMCCTSAHETPSCHHRITAAPASSVMHAWGCGCDQRSFDQHSRSASVLPDGTTEVQDMCLDVLQALTAHAPRGTRSSLCRSPWNAFLSSKLVRATPLTTSRSQLR